MLLRSIKPVLLTICIVGLFFLPMSSIFQYTRSMDTSVDDFSRASSEEVEHTDYHSSDISTFVNDHFVFYVPPATIRMRDRPDSYDGYEYTTGDFIVANLSSLQLFAYENGAKVTIEWYNGTAINGTWYDANNYEWVLEDYWNIKWFDNLPNPKTLKKTINLGEYESSQIQLNLWTVHRDYRIMSGVVKITSDFPISVMHHRLYPIGVEDEDGYDIEYDRWDGVYSAYGKKIFTRITGDCWISALEADTTVQIWDYSDKNDDIVLSLDRFEGWAYSRNPIFEQYGFDDDLVLISADKPVSIVAGHQSDQGFIQVFGRDGKDYLFPNFGKILIHAPTGATIDLSDKAGNQGSFKGTLAPGEIRMFDFKVAYKLRGYSSFEWATLISSDPVKVYTFANNEWYLDVDNHGLMSGEEYFTDYKKITEFYPHGYVPYPAATEFKIPIRSRTYITVVNLDKNENNVNVDFSRLNKPYKTKMNSYRAITLDFSEDSYYYMDMTIPDTGYKQPPQWTTRDPDRRYSMDDIPRIAVDRSDRDLISLEWENITKGSTVTIKSDDPVLVMVNYNKDQRRYPQGIDLIPGLTPPTMRGLPDPPTMIVAFSGLVISADILMIAVGRRSIVEVF
jgi:hypothetical protein